MIRVNQVKMEPGRSTEDLIKKVSHIINVPAGKITDFHVIRKSVDARKHDQVRDVYSVSLTVPDEEKTVSRCASRDVLLIKNVSYKFMATGSREIKNRPVVAGFGPAGIFLSLMLAEHGYRPLVIERGYEMQKREEAVKEFFRTGKLDLNCNVQFGEGGAGTFSDGKLNTLVKDESGRNRFVLETFVKYGAPQEILTSAKPHIGTDRLMEIIPRIRQHIEELGGSIRFAAELTDIGIENGSISSVTVNGNEIINTEALFLCLGHSARDTVKMLSEKKLAMEAKAFAVGVRVEHKRSMVDKAMGFEKAPYKVTHKCEDGRGVYSFCMCPGGYVVNSSSEEGRLCVNGMSYSARDGENSNSAIVVTVDPSDYGGDKDDPLSGVEFQRRLEEKAFNECSGKIPCQRFGDFIMNKTTAADGGIVPKCLGRWAYGNISNILPEFICRDIAEGIKAFDRQLSGFADEDTMLEGVESRTSSPVRILRGSDMQTASVKGIYPAGEGAGYAGGIMSAAMDGLKSAECFAREWKAGVSSDEK